jgi:gliding motility-associated-like protein
MRHLFLSLLLLCCSLLLKAQGENNIWTFGMDSNPAINFNLPTPGITMLPNSPNLTHWASAVCFPNGQLRFYVRLKFNFFGIPEYYIFDPSGNSIAGSDLDTDAGMLDFSMPVVVPKPGNPDQYYIFYGKDDGLRYSVLDMSLNGGSGAVLPTEKDIVLTPPGSIFTRLITAVKGCDATWLVIRSQTANEYYSWPIRATGIDTNKVTSVVGNFPLIDYAFGGFLKAAHDGSRLATTNWKGVEMYDFEQCSGKVINPQVIDTTGNPDYFPAASVLLPSHTRFTGVGFSPDDSKLYVTKNGFLNYELTAGELYQYDVSLPTMPGIVASKVLIFTNPNSLAENFATNQCDLPIANPMGEIKSGPDGRTYIDNGCHTCLDTANVPPGFNPAPGFHVLDAPNNAGALCMPVLNRIVYTNGAEFYGSGYPNSFLQNDIVLAGNADHVPGPVLAVPVCFRDSTILSADANAQCIKWDNGDNTSYRTVYTKGTYYVTYFKNCQVITDTYRVNFVEPPALNVIDSTCVNSPSGRMVISAADGQDNFRAIWKDFSGNVLADHDAKGADTISGLRAGIYSVMFVSEWGCDTTFTATISEYTPFELFVSPIDTTVRYGDKLVLHAAAADFYVWWPTENLDTAIGNRPIATALEPVIYTVVGIDQHGCRDTGYVKIDIDYNMPDLIPNAFSPNGDGLNDVFRIEGITYQKVKTFKIFNRYGQEVFSTMDAAKGWDGTQNGKVCDVGTYHYLIELVYPDKKLKSWKGDVTLLR